MSDADISVDELVELADQAGHGDIAVAMRDIEGAVAEHYPDEDAVDEAMEGVVLPFHDDSRELAFTLGVTFGAFLQEEYPDDPDDE